MGFLTFRFTHKQKGLVNVSGFHVDPGFEGNLALSVYNAGPSNVYFKYKEEVFTIFFFKLHKKVSEDVADRKPMTDLPSEAIEYLSGPPVNIYQLNKKVEKLENKVTTYTQILILIATGLVASLLAYAFIR